MKLTALVADDSAKIQTIFCKLLENLDIKVLAKAFNGLEAVEHYKKFKPHIVFLDILMPKYDGIYALKEIKKFDPDARVVIVTADERKQTREKIKQFGATSIVYKPFQVEDIEILIQQIQI